MSFKEAICTQWKKCKQMLNLSESSVSTIIVCLFAGIFSYVVNGFFICIPGILTGILQHEHPDATKDEVLAKASFYQSVSFAIIAILGVIFLSAIGKLSDIYGRKIILIMCGVSCIVSSVLLFIAFKFNILGAILVGSAFMTAEGAAQVAGMAYVSDVTTDHAERTKTFGLIVGTSVAGTVVSFFLNGYLIEHGPMLPVGIMFLASVACTVILFFFREQRELSERTESILSMLNIFKVLKMLFCTSTLLTMLLVCYALFNAAIADANVNYLYTQHRFGWGSSQNGIQGGIASLSTVFWQFVGLRLFVRLLVDEWLMTGVLLIAAGANIAYGIVPIAWMFYVVSAIAGMQTVFIPMCESVMSKQIDKNDQGALFGGVITVNFIAQFVGDMALENTFTLCLKDHYFSCPGTPYYLGGLILFITFVICVVLFKVYPPARKTTHKYESLNNFSDDDV